MSKKTLEMYRSEFAESILKFNNKPFTLEGRDYFRPFFDLEHPRFLAKCGRQVGKSLTLAAKYVVDASTKPFFKILHVNPTMNQVKVFSSQKLKHFIQYSPYIQKYYMNPKFSVDNVFQKDFSTGSQIILRSAYLTADHIRGIAADMIGLDEIQDLLTDTIPVISETLSGSEYKYRFYTGTPKRFQNPIEDTWKESTMSEYAIKCTHCGKWNIIDEDNLGPNGLICSNPSCNKELDTRNGEWVNMAEPTDKYFIGMRIPQVLSPTVDWDDINYRRRNYPKGKFYNEVLGLPYEDANMPMNEEMLRLASENRDMDTGYNSEIFYGKPLYMGIDWATYSSKDSQLDSYTVLVIGGYDPKGIFRVVYMKKYKGKESDMNYVHEDILRLVQKFRVSLIGVDWGIGAGGINARLRKDLLKQQSNMDPVLEFSLNGNLKILIKWDREGYKYIVSRTQSMSNTMQRIRERRILFPKYEVWKEFANDFLNIYQDYNENLRQIYFTHEKGKPDDAFHALNFCYLAASLGTGRINPYDARITQEPVNDSELE